MEFKTMFKRTLLASAIAVSGGLWANTVLADTAPGQPMDKTAQFGKISEWIGRDVKDQQGNSVGEIADFAVDLNDASIPFVVVQLDGMFTTESIAVPLSALQTIPGDESTVTLAATGSQWKAAKTFDKDGWPLTPTLMTGSAVAASNADTGLVATSEPSTHEAMTDQDHDRAAREAATADQDREFSKLDLDGDGYLSATEIESQSGLSINQESDTNSDGRIDRAEFSAFEAIDQDSKDDAHRSDDR
jgi:hypothetical protein